MFSTRRLNMHRILLTIMLMVAATLTAGCQLTTIEDIPPITDPLPTHATNPEPATVMLVASGLAAYALLKRKKK